MSEKHPLVDHDSVGRRIDLLMQLHKMWSDGLAAMIRGTYHSEWEIEKIKELEAAIKLLNNYMMLGYSDVEYAHEINKLAQLSPEDKKLFGLPEDFVLPKSPEFRPDTGDFT